MDLKMSSPDQNYNMLISITLVVLIAVSPLGMAAFSTLEYVENGKEKFYIYGENTNIYTSSAADRGENGPGDIPSPGIPPSEPVDPGNVTDKIGEFVGTTGSFVSFDTTDEGISSHSFRVGDNETISIFDAITVDDYGIYQEQIIDHTYTLRGNAIEMRMYDNPSALIKLTLNPLESNRSVSFRIGEMEKKEKIGGTIVMGFEDPHMGDYQGSLMHIKEKDEHHITPDIKNGFINYTIQDQTTFIFRMGSNDDISNHIRDEISNGAIGAELRMEMIEDKLKLMPTSYRDVTLMGHMIQEDELDIMASSDTLGEKGTILFLEISSKVIDISSIEDIQLSIDGEIASVMSDYRDIKFQNEPSYWLNIGENDIQLLVNVPHFSSRSITIGYVEEISEQYLGSLTYYLPSAVISAGLVILGVLYQKHKKKNKNVKNQEKKGKNLISIGADPTKYDWNESRDEKRIKSTKKEKKEGTRVRKE